MRITRTLLGIATTGGCLLACVGVVTVPVGALVSVLVVALVVGGCAFVAGCDASGIRPQRRLLASARPQIHSGLNVAIAVAGVGFGLVGAVAVLGPLGVSVLVSVLLPAAAWLCFGWLNGRAGRRGVPQSPAVALLSTTQLCRVWSRSSRTLHDARDDRTRQQAILARRVYLDELERRNPDGFSRWLGTGALAGGDPQRHLVPEP